MKDNSFGALKSKLYYGWQDLEDDCRKLAKILKNKKFDPVRKEFSNGVDCIVGISRGGVIPAAMLAHLLENKKLFMISYSYYSGEVKNKRLVSVSAISRELHGKKILLVDDVVDSGKTMKKAIDDLKKRKNKVISVVLHYKSKLKPKVKPDYFASDPGTAWVVYPWEREY